MGIGNYYMAPAQDPEHFEDCTNKDFYVWAKGDKDPTSFTSAQISASLSLIKLQDQQSWKSTCIAHVTTTDKSVSSTRTPATEIELAHKINKKGVEFTDKPRQSCDFWCSGFGLRCVMAMNAAAPKQQAKLSGWLAQDKQTQCALGEQYWENTHRCDRQLNTQICACDAQTDIWAPNDMVPNNTDPTVFYG